MVRGAIEGKGDDADDTGGDVGIRGSCPRHARGGVSGKYGNAGAIDRIPYADRAVLRQDRRPWRAASPARRLRMRAMVNRFNLADAVRDDTLDDISAFRDSCHIDRRRLRGDSNSRYRVLQKNVDHARCAGDAQPGRVLRAARTSAASGAREIYRGRPVDSRRSFNKCRNHESFPQFGSISLTRCVLRQVVHCDSKCSFPFCMAFALIAAKSRMTRIHNRNAGVLQASCKQM